LRVSGGRFCPENGEFTAFDKFLEESARKENEDADARYQSPRLMVGAVIGSFSVTSSILSLLGELAIQMRNRVSFVPLDTQSSPDRLAACTAEHSQIVAAMADRDAAGAEQATRDHIKKLWESTFRRLVPS